MQGLSIGRVSVRKLNQALPPSIRPLDDALTMVGRARTGAYREVYAVRHDENPYELEIALVDDLQPREVIVFGCGRSTRIARAVNAVRPLAATRCASERSSSARSRHCADGDRNSRDTRHDSPRKPRW